MNLNTVTAVKRPASTDEIPEWREGCAWLAGGTWLFSTPQIDTHTLIDLESLRWPALKATADGLEIAATCTIAELERFQAPTEWAAAPLLRLCSHALLMSFKIYNAATVGGNICMSLPAGAMISLTTSLEGSYNLWPRKGKPRQVSALDFVTGNHKNVLEPGELLRSIHLPASALTKRFAFRRNSLTHLGRSAALIIGTQTKKAATSCSPSRRRRRSRYSFASIACPQPRRCAARSRRMSQRRIGSTTSTGRRPTSATSPITTPSRSGRS